MRFTLAVVVLMLAAPVVAQETPAAPATPETPATPVTPETPPPPPETPPEPPPPPPPEPAAPPTATAPEAGGPVANADPIDKRVQCPKGTLLCWQNEVVAVWPKLRVRPGFEYVDADDQILYIGNNDGFFIDSARIGAEGNVSDAVRFKLTIDAASLLAGAQPNQPVTPVLAAARDAYVGWTPSTWFVLLVGQQNMPSDYEGGDVDAVIPFTRKSVLSSGVRAGHGNAVSGLSPARQIGFVVGSSDTAALGDIPVEYRLGVSNGNGLNQLGNDNNLPAAYLRLGSGFGELLRVGVGGRLNPRTVGTLPNLYDEADYVGFADVAVSVAGVELVALGQLRQTFLTTLVPDPANPAGTESAFGATAWVAYSLNLMDVGVKPAVRLSFYDPSSAFVTDQLAETTIGVRLDGDRTRLPLSFMVDYTILTEVGDLIGTGAPARDIADNRLTALFQIEL